MWPARKSRALEAVQRLQVELPEPFLKRHGPLLGAVAQLLEQSRPVRVLEYGAGELSAQEARQLSRVCAALAEVTGGECVFMTFSEEAAARAGDALAPSMARTRWVDGNASAASSLAGRPFDLLLLHPVGTRNQAHPLHTFWAFTELQPLAADGSYWVFSECQLQQGARCEAVREYLEEMGIQPMAWGAESAWQYKRAEPPLPEVIKSMGALAPLSAEVRMDPGSFLRIYDQVFAPLLAGRAGTFRLMLQTLLSRPGPYEIIETGTTRESGDLASNGQSTLLFDLLVNCFGGRVVTIDIDPTNTRYCRGRTSERTTLICSDSVRALRALPQVAQADLLYLDSYDFDGNNPHPSCMHHMKELAAVWGRTKPSCLLAIDDCFGPEHGKHAYVARFLKSLGVGPHFAGYQTGWLL